MAPSRYRHRRPGKRWPLLGLGAGGAAVTAAVIALAVSFSQAATGRACAAVLAPAGQAGSLQQPGTVPGTATHYVLQGLPNCSYPSPPAGELFAAMPPDEYAGASGCGGYLEVHGPRGSVRVEVIDQCPECAAGHIDLSEAAFAAIAPLNPGLISVTYQHLVNPPLPGPVSLRVKEGSSPYWLALLVMNTGNPLASVQVESEAGSGWQNLARADYNYWVAQSGAGAGPFTVRLTDTASHVVTVRGITLSPATVQGTGTWMYPSGTATLSGPASSSPASPASVPTTTRVQADSTATARRPSHPAGPAAQASSPPARIPSERPATPAASPTC